MSLRTIQRTAIMSVLALGALSASGCDDDETKDTTDAGDNGGNNNNNNNNGDVDAGDDDAGPKPLMCDNSDDACTDNNLGGITLKACCTEGADVCGLDTSVLAAVGVPFAGCYERAAPGVASSHCGKFFDMIDVLSGDEKFNLSIAMREKDPNSEFCIDLTDEQKAAAISFSPCCTPTGECGVFIDNVEFMGSFNLDLGCVAASELMPEPEEMPVCRPKPTAPPTTLPYCNGDSGAGECPAKLTAALCDSLTRQGLGCTVGEDTPDWLCAQFQLPKPGATTPPSVTTGCMKGVPEIARGCGNRAYNPMVDRGFCVGFVDAAVFGCEPVAAGSPFLASVPEYLCGCGKGVIAGARDLCISNGDPAVCGSAVVDAKPTCTPDSKDLLCVGIPPILCGCGDGRTTLELAPTAPCLKNIPLNVCGQGPGGCTGIFPAAEVDSCVGPDQCFDSAPFTSAKDAVGDSCTCSAAFDPDGPGGDSQPYDTCNPNGDEPGTDAGAFDCLPFGPVDGPKVNHCSCGTVGQVGTCAAGKVCTDTDNNMIGDTCVAPT